MTVERHLNAADLKLRRRNPTEEQVRLNAAYEPKNKAFTEANLQGKDLVW